MEDKEQRLIEELKKCRSSIERSKHLIEKHREILKKQEKRAEEIAAKLDQEKMHSLFNLIHKGGYDIDRIRDAVSSGQISDLPIPAPKEDDTTDPAAAEPDTNPTNQSTTANKAGKERKEET